jgi:hypothetical protein
MADKTCEHCGMSFKARPSARYCSIRCAALARPPLSLEVRARIGLKLRGRAPNAGSFKRVRTEPWAPDSWDDGYVDNKGRFRVYRPDFPKADKMGYAMRAHVVYWLATGSRHPDGAVLHHKNEDKLDDRLENLQVMTHGDHTRLHHAETHWFVCAGCGQDFSKTGDEVARRRSEGRLPKYCSLRCYHSDPVRRARHSATIRRLHEEGRY